MQCVTRRCEVVVDGDVTAYRVYEPAAPEPLPLILFLHGAGESGTDDVLPTTVGIGPAVEANPERLPALVVFPQASRGYGWRGFNLAAAVAALDDVEARYNVDRDRVSITGISMGGYGTWLLGLQQPERFAAIVPVCGGLDRSASGFDVAQAAERLKPIPQWVFHGDADAIIPVDESRVMVHALRAAGADVRYTEYPGVQHNSWDRAYAEPELMPWLLRQRRR
ncbi:MAG TPA: prolyl oligopeptidase family serine peptidase [Thermoanaerobaculia bacterium]|nr:prolyl oligopeptidase family serine peptidase [Thermoanaerobaculia bacterium]